MARDFHHRFRIPIGVEESRRRFINRALNDILARYFGIEGFFVRGIDFLERVRLETDVVSSFGERYSAGAALTYAARSFPSCLIALEALHGHLVGFPQEQKFVDEAIRRLLNESEIDVGVSWDGHVFRLTGAPELDDALINQPLLWLEAPEYETVRAPLVKALQHYLESLEAPTKLADVVTDAYEALEAMAKIVTGRQTKDLSANAEMFVSRLGVSEGHKRILKEYISYAQDFRHAAQQSSPRPSRDRRETESFLYLTGMFIRLAIAKP